MVINTHCGLGYVTIEYEGRLWKFADAGDSGQPPAGWHEIDTIYLNEVDGEPIARGPDGKTGAWSSGSTNHPPGASSYASRLLKPPLSRRTFPTV